MRTYTELTTEEQAKARNKALTLLLTDIIEGGLRFNDKLNGDDTQARIDAAADEAEKMQTPWFWAEIMLDDEVLKEVLEGMAFAEAEDALYPQGETIIFI